MAKVKKLDCPHCGAGLTPEPSASLVTCEFCGSQSQVQGTSSSQTDAAPHIPVATYRQGTSKWVWVAVVAPFAISLLASLFALVGSSKGGAGGPGGGAVGGVQLDWASTGRPIAVDANDDGTPDILGWAHKVDLSGGEPSYHLAAFDGETGRRLWLGPGDEDLAPHQSLAAAAGDVAILVDDKGTAHGYELSEGTPRWETALGERAEKLCVGEEGAGVAQVVLADERKVQLSLDDGSMQPAEGEEACAPAWSTASTPPEAGVLLSGTFHGQLDRDIPTEDMDVEAVLRAPSSDRLAVVGAKAKGTRVPMAGAYRCASVSSERDMNRRVYDCEEPELLWTSALPSSDPMKARTGDPEVATLHGGVLYLGYEPDREEDVWNATAFELETGRRLWDVPGLVGDEEPNVIHDLSWLLPLGDRVLSDHGYGAAGVLDAETGEPLFAIGR